jgi:hypothetical protein
MTSSVIRRAVRLGARNPIKPRLVLNLVSVVIHCTKEFDVNSMKAQLGKRLAQKGVERRMRPPFVPVSRAYYIYIPRELTRQRPCRLRNEYRIIIKSSIQLSRYKVAPPFGCRRHADTLENPLAILDPRPQYYCTRAFLITAEECCITLHLCRCRAKSKKSRLSLGGTLIH